MDGHAVQARYVMADERRQAADRRRIWRGGRRAHDHLGGPVVLIVDDHADCRELLAAVLASDGIGSAEASTGEAALRRLYAPPTPSLVILDLGLPDCHGTDIIRTVRADPLTAHVPVLVLSASVRAGDRQAASDAGAAGFMAKPILPDQVLDAVRRALRSREAT